MGDGGKRDRRVRGDPGTPDPRSGWHYLSWLALRQPGRSVAGGGPHQHVDGAAGGDAVPDGAGGGRRLQPGDTTALAGLDTELGADGCRTDGARAQQPALARVVLAGPHTLVLDEATALLDPATARRTERALAAVLESRTVIAVAHRPHTAHDADRVAVMESGHLTKLGTHEELVATDGAYAALWRTWHGQAAAPAGEGPAGPGQGSPG